MAEALSLPLAEIAVMLAEGKLKARAVAEEAIGNHERFGAKLMAYSQWARSSRLSKTSGISLSCPQGL